jgi:hypothetical protein
MKIGLLLWEVVTLTVIVFGALCLFLLRNWFSRTDGEVRWGLWLRFSVVLLALSVVSLVEGVLLSPFGFNWFLLALVITLYVVKKFAPRMLGWER